MQGELFREIFANLEIAAPEEIAELQHQFAPQMGKSVGFGCFEEVASIGSTAVAIRKAQEIHPPGVLAVKNRHGGHRSHLTIDHLGVISGGMFNQNWVEKQSPYGFAALKAMVDGCWVLNAVVVNYIREIQQFATPYRSQDEHPLGFTILPKDKKIGDKLTPDEELISKKIETFMMNCGDCSDPRERKWNLQRDNFSGFLSKLIRDTLTMDACPIETERSINGKRLAGIYNIAGDTVRICHEYGYEGDDRIIAVQTYNDLVVAFYTPNDIIYEVRNPRTDLFQSRYGYAETEMIVRIVTGLLNAVNYNMYGFDRNNLPRGILTLFGNFDTKQLNSFQRQWNSMLSGPAGRWKMPAFVSKDSKEAGAHFERVDMEFNEMHFAKWMSFLVSIICAVYGKSPENINMDSFSSRPSSLSGNDTSERLAASKDKGLEPLMSWIEGVFNEYIIPVYQPGYEMHFVGLHQDDQEHIFEVKMATMTVDEGRRMVRLDPSKDCELGELPLNPALLQHQQQKDMMEAQANQPDPTEEEQYGVPQNAIDRMKEQGEGGGQPGPVQHPSVAGQQNGGKPNPGPDKLQAERSVGKGLRIFREVPLDDDKYAGWTL